MFTGIVQGLCSVASVADEPQLRRLAIRMGPLADGVATGASVSVNGTCLTVTALSDGLVSFDVIHETLSNTNLGDLAQGSLVNVERSFRVGDEVGGHILSGHVAGQVTVGRVESDQNRRDLVLDVPPRWMKYLHHKGFVALDGASLTLAEIDQSLNQIRISLIPETVERTTLGRCQVGDHINLEVDAQTQSIVDTVERLLETPEMVARMAVQPGTRD